jgi:hypothetical protein
MIHHLSIAARDPKHSAEVLAEIMGDKAVPFPPNPGSFFALQLDDHGSGVEVYPAGTELQPAGEEGGSFVRKPREGARLRRHALRAQRRGRRGQSETDRRACQLALCDLQSRAVPRDRGLGRERYDGRGFAAGLRRRIPGLDPPGPCRNPYDQCAKLRRPACPRALGLAHT